jgi:hypothetical protein
MDTAAGGGRCAGRWSRGARPQARGRSAPSASPHLLCGDDRGAEQREHGGRYDETSALSRHASGVRQLRVELVVIASGRQRAGPGRHAGVCTGALTNHQPPATDREVLAAPCRAGGAAAAGVAPISRVCEARPCGQHCRARPEYGLPTPSSGRCAASSPESNGASQTRWCAFVTAPRLAASGSLLIDTAERIHLRLQQAHRQLDNHGRV